MRVGFVTHLLWDRYGPFWESLARAAGADVVLPTPDAILDRLGDPRVAVADAVVFRLVVAAALALEDVDLLVVPRLNPAEAADRGADRGASRGAGRGAGQDPWASELPDTLRRSVPGLPTPWGVDVDLSRPLETNAVTFLRRLTPDVGLVRRAWSQHRSAIRAPRRTGGPRRTGPAAPAAPGAAAVAIVGPPWWTVPAVAGLALRPAERAWSGTRADPADLRMEARRADPDLVDTDAEALGAVRRAARAGDVTGLRLLIDGASGSDHWLARRAQDIAPSRVEVVDVRDLAEPERLLAALLHPAP